jgi:transcriptional regulator with GAF, ATPase, and Fis domain
MQTSGGAEADLALVVEGVPTPLREGLTLGSSGRADVRVSDRFVSSLHAVVERRGDTWLLVDRGSKNGVWVGGTRVDACRLSVGLVVALGRVRITVVALGLGRSRGAAASCDPGDVAVAHGGMVGDAPAFRAMLTDLQRVAAVVHPVLLRGETGTGKELAARYIHDIGARAGRPFVAINCASIVDNLAESSLFGHVRGAFTGAVRAHAGAFVAADHGTLFLDEVGELPLPLQAKLLRALEQRRVLPVGGELEVPVDVRVIAATHRDVVAMVRAGRFREDLYHRLGVLLVELPPLRERPTDIPLLLDAFVRKTAAEIGRPVSLAPGCAAAASRHRWPGNIRELANAVVRAATMDDGPITAQRLLASATTVTGPADSPSPADLGDAMATASGDWASIEHDMLRRLVAEHGSIRRAAAALGLPRSTLGARLRRRSNGDS